MMHKDLCKELIEYCDERIEEMEAWCKLLNLFVVKVNKLYYWFIFVIR